MINYQTKKELIDEIEKTSKTFIMEFENIEENEKNLQFDTADKTPYQMLAYQLGWLNLILQWDNDEKNGLVVITPSSQYKWNNLVGLYNHFYDQYQERSLQELRQLYTEDVTEFIQWVGLFSEEELFQPDMRQWACSTSSKWPVWKWIHINTVAPFKNFRTKIRKWKKYKAENTDS